MGFLHPKKIYVTLIGRDKQGNVIVQKELQTAGFITGLYSDLDPIFTKLDKENPGLEWEYHAIKD